MQGRVAVASAVVVAVMQLAAAVDTDAYAGASAAAAGGGVTALQSQVQQALRVSDLEASEEVLRQQLAALQAELDRRESQVAFDHQMHPGLVELEHTTPMPTASFGPVKVPELEYEDFLLLVAIMLIMLIFAVPFMTPWNRFCETRRHKVMPVLAILNFSILAYTLDRLYMISFNTMFFGSVKAFEIFIGSTESLLTGCVALVGLFVAWRFKDRILAFIGIEHGALLVGDFRDWATCWSMKRFHAMEIYILKVEGLPSVKITGENNVFCEASLGYNMEMRTRVHNGAGHRCVFKESFQLNFDPWDTDSRLYISVKNQGLISEEISSVQIGAAKVRKLEEKPMQKGTLGWGATSGSSSARSDQSAWDPKRFTAFDMVPAGTIYLRFVSVAQEEESVSFFECCCGCLFGGSRRAQVTAVSDTALLTAQH